MSRILDIIVWAILLAMFIVAFALAAGCTSTTPLAGHFNNDGSYERGHDDAWREQQDHEDPFMQFLGHIAEGSFHAK